MVVQTLNHIKISHQGQFDDNDIFNNNPMYKIQERTRTKRTPPDVVDVSENDVTPAVTPSEVTPTLIEKMFEKMCEVLTATSLTQSQFATMLDSRGMLASSPTTTTCYKFGDISQAKRCAERGCINGV